MEATATKTETVTFIAWCVDQHVVVQTKDIPPPDAVLNHRGQVVETIPGRVIEFSDHEYQTSDPVEIEFIRNHELFNSKIWEKGNAPDEPKPTIQTQTAAIAKAAAAGDVAAINEVLRVERETHNRDVVFAVASAAVEGLEGDEEKDKSPSEPSNPDLTPSLD